jgi:signal transduction histidine kinase
LTSPGSLSFEVTLWRALAVFRLATLAYATVLVGRNFATFEHPYAAWVVVAVMGAWSVLSIAGYATTRGRPDLARLVGPLLAADFLVTATVVLSSRWVEGADVLSEGTPTLPVTWMACPVLAVAVARGRALGAVAAVGMGACDLLARGVVNQATFTGTAIMIMAALAVGHVAGLAAQTQEQLRLAAEREAATRERERLARGIHDSVLQVLALVQRRGAELGGEAADLGRLAGEQEAALRALVGPSPGADPVPAGLVDLRLVLGRHAAPTVAISAPATGVWLPARAGHELSLAVAAAVENVRRHCPEGVRAWILIEDEPGAVTVTVRDDGPGIPTGRLEQAAAEGRLGLAQSVCGRIRDLGGTVSVTSAPGEGTEIEMTLHRRS